MYKVLIVDDEQIVVDGIKFMLESQYEDISVVATSNTGREAIELTREIIPDIVFMDIRMPGINGIEAIDSIKKKHNNVKFIIISAHEQFELAKEAVSLGVSYYILKPVGMLKLKSVLDKVLQEIDEERFLRSQHIENQDKLERIIPMLEQSFIYTLLLNVDSESELHKYRDLFNMADDKVFIMTLDFSNIASLKTKNALLTEHSLYSKIQNEIKYKCKSIVGPIVLNRMTIVVFSKDDVEEYEDRIKTIQLAQNLKNSIGKVIKMDLTIGIGATYPLENIRYSLDESIYAINKASLGMILHINDLSNPLRTFISYSFADIKNDQIQMVHLIETYRVNELEHFMKLFFSKVEMRFEESIIDIRNIIIELMVMVLNTAYRNELEDKDIGYTTYIIDIFQINNLIALENWCAKKVVMIAQLINSKSLIHKTSIVYKAKTYIDEHYNSDFRLTDISMMISVSPQYLSKIFKETLGISFVEYIRIKRIEVAKDMLKNKNHSVKEICYEIGYNDPNYFSRLFKKMVGVSPTDYN